MKQFDEWLFEISVPNGKDAHYSLVHWLRRNGLGNLFTESYKAITYVVFETGSGYGLIAKSCVPISLPIVEKNTFTVDLARPVKVVVQLTVKKRIRTPNLKYETQTSLRDKNIVRNMTDSEKNDRINAAINEMGFNLEHTTYEIHEGIDIPIYHKREKLFILEPTMNVIFEGVISDPDKFDSAWRFGIGNKKVYGLGCVRILHD